MNNILLILCLTMLVAMVLTCYILISRIKRLNEATRQEFRIMSAESIARSAEALKSANNEQLSSILDPLRMRIEDFNRQIRESHIDAAASRHSLSDQIERLSRLNLTISNEARNLASALKGNNRIQGRWGETVLETILEKAGLKKGINYDTQISHTSAGTGLRDDTGNLRRPDMIVYLPNNRQIVIDAKTSLSAYLEYCEAPDGDISEDSAKRHVASVKKHIDELAAKNYPKLFSNSLEQVLMFIPNDAALIFALDKDRTLAEYAFSKNITLVSPTQILGIIMLVSQMWKREQQDRNAAEIARLGGLLYDTVAGFVSDMQNIEKGLNVARNAYDSAFSKLTGSQRSIRSRAEKLKDLGAKTTRNIPFE